MTKKDLNCIITIVIAIIICIMINYAELVYFGIVFMIVPFFFFDKILLETIAVAAKLNCVLVL